MNLRKCFVLLALAAFPAEGSAQQPPNTLLVILDDVGVDLIGRYGVGTDPAPTPTLDSLAERGLLFERAYANPSCSPTRAALYTGRYGFRTGVGSPESLGAIGGLDYAEVLLPELLDSAGIRTALIGKWHLGTQDAERTPELAGFGTFIGTLGGGVNNYNRWPKVKGGQTQTSRTYATTDLVDEAVAYVAATSEPWFLSLAFQAPHTPLHAPAASLHTQNLNGLDPAISPRPFAKAMLEALDTELGRLLQTIDPQVLARTNIVVIGDNGTANQVVTAPFSTRRAKGSIYEGGVRVPMVAAGPDVLRHREVEPNLVHVVDLFATLAELQGIDARARVPASVELDSASFASRLSTSGAATRTLAYSEGFNASPWISAQGDGQMIQDVRWKLMRIHARNGNVNEELYDLSRDPFEATNRLTGIPDAEAHEAHLRLSGELARLRGEAWSHAYGEGCPAGAPPQLLADSAPLLGTTFRGRVVLAHASAPNVLLLLGFDRSSWSGVPLPLDLSPLGALGCHLLAAPESVTNWAVSQGQAAWAFSLPNDALLTGFGAQLQASALDPGAPSIGLAFSGGLDLRLGIR